MVYKQYHYHHQNRIRSSLSILNKLQLVSPTYTDIYVNCITCPRGLRKCQYYVTLPSSRENKGYNNNNNNLTFKSKMAAVGHVENQFFSGLAYSTMQFMILGVLGVKEFIFDAVLISLPIFDLQIQDGCHHKPILVIQYYRSFLFLWNNPLHLLIFDQSSF